jgi:hypothetical protein
MRSKCDNDNDTCHVDLSDDYLNKIIIDITTKRNKIIATTTNNINKNSGRSIKLFDYNGLIQFIIIFIIMLMEVYLTHKVKQHTQHYCL